MSFWNVRTFRVLIGVYIACVVALIAAYLLGLDPWVRYAITAVGLIVGAVLMFYPNRAVVPQTILGAQWSLVLTIVTVFAFLGPLTLERGIIIGGAVLLAWLLVGLGIAAYGTALQDREKAATPVQPSGPASKKSRPPAPRKK